MPEYICHRRALRVRLACNCYGVSDAPSFKNWANNISCWCGGTAVEDGGIERCGLLPLPHIRPCVSRAKVATIAHPCFIWQLVSFLAVYEYDQPLATCRRRLSFT